MHGKIADEGSESTSADEELMAQNDDEEFVAAVTSTLILLLVVPILNDLSLHTLDLHQLQHCP